MALIKNVKAPLDSLLFAKAIGHTHSLYLNDFAKECKTIKKTSNYRCNNVYEENDNVCDLLIYTPDIARPITVDLPLVGGQFPLNA